MKIRIREVLSSGLGYQDQVMPRDIGLEEEFVDLEIPIVVSGRLTRVDSVVLASLNVKYAVGTFCARCLEDIHQDVSVKYDFDFEIVPGEDYIDIGARIREELLLGFDVHTLCRDDCKGICPDCGAHLNKEKCRCGENRS
jgi:uncharacterized protein